MFPLQCSLTVVRAKQKHYFIPTARIDLLSDIEQYKVYEIMHHTII
jgi:hypothetical protein